MSVREALAWEVVIVDNNSHDDTKAVVDSFRHASRLEVRYIFEGRQGLSRARNAGVEAARGHILSFIDDDVVVSPQWLAAVDHAFAAHPVVVCVGGRVVLPRGLSRPAWWRQTYDNALGSFDRGHGSVFSDPNETELVGIGANLSFRRVVFEHYGLFRTDLGRQGKNLLMGEEVEFCDRLSKKRESLMYCSDAWVYHCPEPERLKRTYLRRWYFRVGEWRFARETSLGPRREARIRWVPRWAVRAFLGHLWRMAVLACTGHGAEAFHQELQGVLLMGYMYGAAKRGLGRALDGREQ